MTVAKRRTASPTSIAVYHAEIKGEPERSQAEQIWLHLPPYEAGKGNSQGLNSREISQALGIPRCAVTGRLNGIETGKLTGASVIVFVRPDDKGRRVKHYCRSFGNFAKPRQDAITDHAAALWAEIIPAMGDMNVEVIDRYLRKHFRPKKA